ncbi:hypothetical protein KFV02_05915 [Desulfohalobiaceae bacterium Ax17]|uniref:hypothetical protein n=1 Tax=Desulfovulcanus ferrireducens TaxID=2831190 RepID=UPI00207BA512|nr:hypothetical protein [Desulfovulcanus ferrireducens]MBT8763465.1 hypothetical protein [Desulfovulcanus ferrireducens]
MSKTWICSKLPEFVRDVLRDFCLVSQQLEQEFQYLDQTGQIRFQFFKDILGEKMNKGQLWHLKDTAHILFKHDPKAKLIGQYLDWSLGYIFHECMKLREDAYQQENYRPWFEEIQSQQSLSPEERLITQELLQVIEQTKESIDREVKRVRFIQFHCRRLFILYLPYHKDNPLLARFLFARHELVKNVFKTGGYNELIQAIYGDAPEHMYILAAQSLRLGGWIDEARQAIKQAHQMAPNNKLVLQEMKLIDNNLENKGPLNAKFQNYRRLS